MAGNSNTQLMNVIRMSTVGSPLNMIRQFSNVPSRIFAPSSVTVLPFIGPISFSSGMSTVTLVSEMLSPPGGGALGGHTPTGAASPVVRGSPT